MTRLLIKQTFFLLRFRVNFFFVFFLLLRGIYCVAFLFLCCFVVGDGGKILKRFLGVP